MAAIACPKGFRHRIQNCPKRRDFVASKIGCAIGKCWRFSASDDSLADDEANQLVDSISSSVAIYSLNDLGRDARTTSHLLVDELPFGSADEWGL